ncbi:hypothetical protein [Hyphomicrobium sp.]|uniref:hypothetical protein n=1 Tax=Hyphomicrobium sp. TaxID=82 RepID=UPI002FE020C1
MRFGADCLLCEYFNKNGRRIEQIGIADGDTDEATRLLRERLAKKIGKVLLQRMRAEAEASGALTSLDDAAMALHALIHDVAEDRIPIDEARKVTSVSVNYCRAVAVADIVPTLEARFGGNAASWVRGIFPHLNFGPAGLN